MWIHNGRDLNWMCVGNDPKLSEAWNWWEVVIFSDLFIEKRTVHRWYFFGHWSCVCALTDFTLMILLLIKSTLSVPATSAECPSKPNYRSSSIWISEERLRRIQNDNIYYTPSVKMSSVRPISQLMAPTTIGLSHYKGTLFVKTLFSLWVDRLHNQAHRSLPCVPY